MFINFEVSLNLNSILIIVYKMEWKLLVVTILTCVSIYFVYRKLVEIRNEMDEIQDRLDQITGDQSSGEKVIMHPFTFTSPTILQ